MQTKLQTHERNAMLAAFLVASGCLTGCTMQTADDPYAQDESITSVQEAFEEDNKFDYNGYQNNGYQNNGFVDNNFVRYSLTPEGVVDGVMTALQQVNTTGEFSRSLLKYMVSCALSPAQSFQFDWNDGFGNRHETYYGSVGIAPEWVSGPISLAKQKRVSSCLAARTNFFGITVRISMRGSVLGADQDEKSSYSKREGAFWGNLFSTTSYLKSCYDPANVANSRSKYRDCAAGYPNGSNTDFCGRIESVGPCSTVCVDNADSTDGYASCEGDSNVFTTFLP